MFYLLRVISFLIHSLAAAMCAQSLYHCNSLIVLFSRRCNGVPHYQICSLLPCPLCQPLPHRSPPPATKPSATTRRSVTTEMGVLVNTVERHAIPSIIFRLFLRMPINRTSSPCAFTEWTRHGIRFVAASQRTFLRSVKGSPNVWSFNWAAV